jgi:hypothetical protein
MLQPAGSLLASPTWVDLELTSVKPGSFLSDDAVIQKDHMVEDIAGKPRPFFLRE